MNNSMETGENTHKFYCMGIVTLEKKYYETWDMAMPNDFKKTALYHLKPVGTGTVHAESLTSYVARLAEAHGVLTGTLVVEEIIPVLGKNYLRKIVNRGGKGFSDCAVSLNGIGSGAADFINAMGKLTENKDLKYHTLITWGKILPTKSLLRKERAWCPQCYEEWENSSKVIYDPLIWYVWDVEVCNKHLVRLQTKCHHCNKCLPILNRYTKPGYCSFCNGWLGRILTCSTENKYSDWDVWRAREVGRVIAASLLRDTPNKQHVFVSIRELIKRFSGDNIQSFAKKVGIPKVTLWDWVKEKNMPTITGLLKISYSTEIPLLSIVTGCSENILVSTLIKEPIRSASNRRKPKNVNVSVIKTTMESFLDSDEFTTVSVSCVAKKVGFDRRLLYKYFPDTCKAISSKYMYNKKLCKKMRLKSLSESVRCTAIELLEKGIYPSTRQVELCIGSGVLREIDIRQAWHQTVKDFIPDDKSIF
ncbi:TniQ family protein [Brevibacillus sp. RS1.1]|uniref:TniQ family protein n=1 Tax=Brevibacillus sp. RS1.1 TaxID=2738982 RepID=UPI00156AC15C|nr:TniQ family protein [Brevibacillus sp. RS1.1]NRR05510.1 TniQ family protein [Brevibacillus sp. RS1.1]